MSKQKSENQSAPPIGIDSAANNPSADEQSKQTPPEDLKQADQANEPERGRQTEDRRPICPYHHKPCTSQRSDNFFTRYKCNEDGCTFSTKVARPQILKRVRQAEERDRDRPPR